MQVLIHPHFGANVVHAHAGCACEGGRSVSWLSKVEKHFVHQLCLDTLWLISSCVLSPARSQILQTKPPAILSFLQTKPPPILLIPTMYFIRYKVRCNNLFIRFLNIDLQIKSINFKTQQIKPI